MSGTGNRLASDAGQNALIADFFNSIWTKAPVKVLEDTAAPFYRWFADAEANTCNNVLDRHVETGCGDQPAIIQDNPVTGSTSAITYSEMLEKVSHPPRVLAARGIEKGDRVVICVPKVPEALVAMLACARIGAIRSVVFGGMQPTNLPSASTMRFRRPCSAPYAEPRDHASSPTSPFWMRRSLRPGIGPSSP
jgi:hypothetical protein